jgi:2'-5' RNA ligase
LGYFQKRDKGVLYAGIEQNRKLSALEQTITGQINRLGLAEGGRSFSPHITLARLKDNRNFEEYRRKYEGGLKTSWKVEEFHLYRSENKQAGEQRYSVLETFPLSPY